MTVRAAAITLQPAYSGPACGRRTRYKCLSACSRFRPLSARKESRSPSGAVKSVVSPLVRLSWARCIEMAELSRKDRYIIHHITTCIAALRRLNPDNLYKSEVLCCEFWRRIKTEKHSPVGTRLYQLTKGGYLPLEPIGKDSDNSMMYRLK